MIHIEAPFLAPVPVGHRVTLLGVEYLSSPLFGGPSRWEKLDYFLVCDEDTRIVYADQMVRLHTEATYEQLRFASDSYRLSQSQPPLRGRVGSCVVLSDHGERVHLRTVLGIEPDGPLQRF